MTIRVLDPDVVGKIAAGEVVERPASVVKELVENALDAGARSIRVEILGGGCELIRVADDGHGIPGRQLPLALERHATSKIRSAEELGAIRTLGFRGEALASIAAVSELTLLSRERESSAAYLLQASGGVVGRVGPAARAPGTTVAVEGLFFNVPARRKFLRTAAGESTQVAQVVGQFALAYPEVAFELTMDGRRSVAAPGTGKLIDAALAMLGREVAAALLAVEAEIEYERPHRGVAARLTGYAATPGVDRSNRAAIWLFVNRRPIRSRTLTYAVEEGYQTLLQVGRHPVAVLNLQVPPSEVDVNVHPAKAEVRLLRERLIYGGIRDAVRSAVGGGAAWGKEMSAPSTSPEEEGEGEGPPEATPRLVDPAGVAVPAGSGEVVAAGRRLPILRLVGQVAQAYIVAEGERGLYLIDQHAAHERVLHDRLVRSLDREGNTQLLLEPVSLELTPAQREVAAATRGALESLGFRLEPFGEGTLLIRGIPGELPPGLAVQALERSLEDLAEEKPEGDWRERVAVALSCRGAVKAGQILALEEMRSLVEALEETDITQHCSHGRPTAILLSHRQLEREFGRR